MAQETSVGFILPPEAEWLALCALGSACTEGRDHGQGAGVVWAPAGPERQQRPGALCESSRPGSGGGEAGSARAKVARACARVCRARSAVAVRGRALQKTGSHQSTPCSSTSMRLIPGSCAPGRLGSAPYNSTCVCRFQCRAQFADDLLDDCDGEDLCGVGIVFYKAPDNSLFVKVACQRGARD